MKRKKLFLPLLFIPFVLLLIYFLFNQNDVAKSSSNLDDTEMKPVIKKAGSLNILIDPRIELLSAVQLDSDYDILTKLNFTYGNDMKEYFKSYKNHKAVKIFKKLSNTGYSYDAPPTSMLYLSNPPMLEQRIDFDHEIKNRAGNERNLLNFIKQLRKFNSDANFKEFYEKNLPLYQTIIDTVYNNVKDMNITKALDDYYGMGMNSYNIILAPMFHSGGYGPRIKGKNGLYDVYGILGPINTIMNQNGEIVPDFSVDTIRYLTWHEFSHSFVNPTTEKYIDEINKYSNLFSVIRKQMEAQAYPAWEICVNEHIVRAITTRLTYMYDGENAGDQAMAYEKSCGFYYIEALCDSLKIYEENRDIYPTFESYYKELIKVFEKLSKENITIKFEGPINQAFNFNNLNTVFIIPTNEEDKNTQKEIVKYVGLIKDKFFTDAIIMEDIDALNEDLGDKILIAYGTIDGNLWVKEYSDTFPFQIDTNKLVADKEYKDDNLVLISTLPNPQNNNNPLVIYTAKQSTDILNINSINHGITDYVIAKDGQEITSGYYKKENGVWEFKQDN